MRIHLISNLFYPDELAGASLYTDMALFLRDAGHDVRVTTTFSYYPAWRIRPEDAGITIREEDYAGLPIRRISMFVPELPSGRGRLMSDLSFLWSLIRRGQFRDWQPDVILTALPMLSQCLALRHLYAFRGVRKMIVVQDFVVEAALELGILKFPGAAFFLKRLQRWALRSADTLATISPVMLEKLRAQVGSDRRTVFIPNWIHQSLQTEIQLQMQQQPQRNTLSLFYAGNLGVKQGLPSFLKQFSESGAGRDQWLLSIHGGGAEKSQIEQAASNGLGIQVGPVLSEPEYITRLLTTTACLVAQMPGTGANFLPSKLLPALATGTPVLAVCEASSPLAKEVQQGEFGEVIEPGDSVALRRCLMRWQQNPQLLRRMQENAKKRAGLFQRENVLGQYEQELKKLVTSETVSKVT